MRGFVTIDRQPNSDIVAIWVSSRAGDGYREQDLDGQKSDRASGTDVRPVNVNAVVIDMKTDSDAMEKVRSLVSRSVVVATDGSCLAGLPIAGEPMWASDFDARLSAGPTALPAEEDVRCPATATTAWPTRGATSSAWVTTVTTICTTVNTSIRMPAKSEENLHGMTHEPAARGDVQGEVRHQQSPVHRFPEGKLQHRVVQTFHRKERKESYRPSTARNARKMTRRSGISPRLPSGWAGTRPYTVALPTRGTATRTAERGRCVAGATRTR